MKQFTKSILFLTGLIAGSAPLAFSTTPSYNMAQYVPSSNTVPPAPVTFQGPNAVAVGGNGNVFIASSVGITKITKLPTGVVATLISGSGANAVTNARGVVIDTSDMGTLYTVDQNNRVFKLAKGTYAQAIIATNEATKTAGVTYDPVVKLSANFGGSATATNAISGIAVDSNHNVYLADTTLHVIWKLTPQTTGILFHF